MRPTTRPTPRLQPAAFAAAALAAVAVACAVESPDRATAPAAARASTAGPSAATPNTAQGSYFEFQVEKTAATVPGSLSANYPETLKARGGDGRVTAQFVVDTTGRADMSTWKVLESTNDLFAQSAKDGVGKARFYPAETGGHKVKQLVQLPFTFSPR